MYSCRFRFLGLIVAGLFITSLVTTPLMASSSMEITNKTAKVLPKTLKSLELSAKSKAISVTDIHLLNIFHIR